MSWNTPKASKKFQAKIEYHERIAKEKETRAENGQSDPVATWNNRRTVFVLFV